ncbi:tRNA-dihydrouridine synthase A [gamma proteobacterium HdN1]|nr:tRNA-dihydrouridine synthase A [gamma proteobacterium HdN1]
MTASSAEPSSLSTQASASQSQASQSVAPQSVEHNEPRLCRRLSVAPMLDWTDRHARYMLRQISQRTLLYTEMVTTGALLHTNPARWLDYHHDEHPLALQLGGNQPHALAQCVKLAAQWQYDEVNLNVGCPSDRVQEGAFGACLMATPNIVADCVKAMQDASNLPITVKCRIGIDDQDEEQGLQDFIETVQAAGCKTFIVHARKAWLKGLSPKENREIPPLNYPRVHRLKKDFPDLELIINGGFKTLDECAEQLAHLDGVMIGREAYHNPMVLADADQRIFGATNAPICREALIHKMHAYAERQYRDGVAVKHITRHMLGLLHGIPGGRRWRRVLSEKAPRDGATPDILLEAWHAATH